MNIKAVVEKLQSRFIIWFNNYFGKKSWEAALAKAKKINTLTGKKMYVILLNGEYVAVPKQEFKIMWQRNPAMKQKTLADWQKHIYEYCPESK